MTQTLRRFPEDVPFSSRYFIFTTSSEAENGTQSKGIPRTFQLPLPQAIPLVASLRILIFKIWDKDLYTKKKGSR